MFEFIIFLVIIYLFYLLYRYFFRSLLYRYVEKKLRSMADGNSVFDDKRKTHRQPKTAKKKKLEQKDIIQRKFSDGEGDYIDFSEIKEKKDSSK